MEPFTQITSPRQTAWHYTLGMTSKALLLGKLWLNKKVTTTKGSATKTASQQVHITHLPKDALISIFQYLGPKNGLTLSCRYFNAIDKTIVKFEKVSAFVLDNYTVHSSSEKTEELFRSFFFMQQNLGLGETHISQEHRLLNGLLVNLIFTSNHQVYIEGGPESLKISKQSKNGMLQYIKQEAVDSAETWDIEADRIKTDKTLEIAVDFVSMLKVILLTFRKFEKTAPEDYRLFFQIILNHSITKCLCPADEYLKKYSDLYETHDYIDRETLIIAFKIKILRNCISYYSKKMDENKKHWQLNLEWRDIGLKNTAFQAMKTGKSNIYICGSKHLDAFTEEFQRRKNLYHNFLCLTPKDSITAKSIMESYQKRISPILPAEVTCLQRNSTKISQGDLTVRNELYLKDEDSYTVADLPCLIDSFLGVKSLGFEGENHFSIWIAKARIIINLEISRLKKELPQTVQDEVVALIGAQKVLR